MAEWKVVVRTFRLKLWLAICANLFQKVFLKWKHFWVVVSDGLTNVISHTDLVSSFKYVLCSPRKLGKWSNLTNVFSKGLNHQRDVFVCVLFDKFDITQQFKQLKSSTQNFKTADSFYRQEKLQSHKHNWYKELTIWTCFVEIKAMQY